ncbi:WAT1-related protein At5g47470-like [Silene latifolia]|uniref:WAT1-related protein At5g47470-like n=1 Tax=Silene latifolia TaxID=37657 RepID=UPI003D78728F
MSEHSKKDVVEDVIIIGGLIGVQFVFAGNSVLSSYLLSLGINPLSLVTFSAFATFIVLSPVSFVFERKQWPKEFSLKLLIQLVLISFSGVTLFQSLLLKGISLTSPTMATAMPNLAPGLIFLIAWACRLEQVTLSCTYSRVKIVGTSLCVIGAITMSIFQGSHPTKGTDGGAPTATNLPPYDIADTQQIIGCLYLTAAVFVLSSNVVLQAQTLGDFPAPMTLCAVTSLIGVLITILVQLLQEHQVTVSCPLVSLGELLVYSLLAGTVSGICVSFNGWAMKKRGPVVVSVFNPISTVISAILSAVILQTTISLGSLAGMCLMFIGLYFVLWAKGKEGFPTLVEEILDHDYDPKKPLLAA